MTRAIMETDKGTIHLELFDNKNPVIIVHLPE